MVRLRFINNVTSLQSRVTSPFLRLPAFARFQSRTSSKPRQMNEEIKENFVHLLGIDGKIVNSSISTDQALGLRKDWIEKNGKDLNIVMLKPRNGANLAVCKMIPVVESNPEEDKKDSRDQKANKKGKKIEVKVLNLTNQITDNDLQFKVKNAVKWLEKGSEVQVAILTRAASGEKWTPPSTSFTLFDKVIAVLKPLETGGRTLTVIKKPTLDGAKVIGNVRLQQPVEPEGKE